MSTGLIVVLVVAAIIILGLLVALPRMRETARRKKAERELHSRRQAVADEHRSVAREREGQAEIAEQKARMAQQAAERERAEAGMQQQRAEMHERGMADDELIDDHERDRFAGVAGPESTTDRDADGHTLDDRARTATGRDTTADADRDADGHTLDDRARAATGRDTTAAEQGAVSPDYERGREDERRFERNRITDDVRESERTPPRP